MPTFQEVGMAILSERKYQDAKWADLDKVNQPDDFITYIEKYVAALRAAPAEQKQDFFRKVAALGVVAMEKFGAPHREGYEIETCGGVGNKACDGCPMDDRCPTVLKITKAPRPLSDEQIEKMVKDQQKAVVIERGVYYRVKEKRRTYHYNDAYDSQHIFTDIRAFAVMPSGGHRLLDDCGVWYYVQPGWNVLAVDGGIDGGVEVQ